MQQRVKQDWGVQPVVSAAELQWALDNELFNTQFQPIVRVSDGVPVSVEALARLNHPYRGTIQPDNFVPQMEHAGLALNLADQVADHALGAVPPGFLARHQIAVAINLPLDVLIHPASLIRMEAVREKWNVPSRCLSVELTESQPVTDFQETGRAITRWRQAGYDLALDDVGPDTPHCRALLSLPFTAIKFDKSVLSNAIRDNSANHRAHTIVSAAHKAGLHVVIEGVEDQSAWRCATAIGADYVQGFLVAKPMPACELPSWLAQWRLAS